jgi:hypothetical protein
MPYTRSSRRPVANSTASPTFLTTLRQTLYKIRLRVAHAMFMVLIVVIALVVSRMLENLQVVLGLPTQLTASSQTRQGLLDMCLSTAAELGFKQDWWITKISGLTFMVICTFLAMMTISFSAVFQCLCLSFILWKKWNSIHEFVTQLATQKDSLGVF